MSHFWVRSLNWVFRAAAGCLCVAAFGTPLWAQPPEPANIRGDSAQTRKRLGEAEQKLLAGKATDASEDLQRIVDEAGSDLVSLDGKRFLPAQWIASQILVKLPPDALKSYQDQIETPARKLLETAKRNRDTAPLWKLLDRFFVSRANDEGMFLLGDLLFERGEFRAAELVWRRLLPDANADIAYPNSKLDPAQVRARLILAAIFRGDLDRAKNDFAGFQTKYAESRGSLAGKTGLLANILSEQLKNPPDLNMSSNTGAEWPAFGGGPGHAGSVGRRLPVSDERNPSWSADLENSVRSQNPVRHAFGHPIVIDGQVFVTDGFHLYGFDLLTGSRIPQKSIATVNRGSIPTQLGVPALQEKGSIEVCPTLTAAAGRIYVRCGPQIVNEFGKATKASDDDSAIVCFALKSGIGKSLEELWRLRPPSEEGKSTAIWEGTPQVSGRRMWAAYTRSDGGRITHGIACYDPADSIVAPDHPAWAVDVCDSQVAAAVENRPHQDLVTLVGRKVVLCSNTGAVVALDAVSGRRAWAFRYSRSRKPNTNRYAAPAAAVAYGGRLFVAPSDCNQVYALDPESGELLWVSDPADGPQIIGVADEKLMIAVAGSRAAGDKRGIRGLNVETGSFLKDGWNSQDSHMPRVSGQGFATDDLLIIPTVSGLYALRAQNGALATFARNIPGRVHNSFTGNVAYADGVLIVVTENQIFGYLSDAKLFGPPSARTEGDPIRRQFNKLTTLAEVKLAEGKIDLAREILFKVAKSELPSNYRAWAAARLVLLTPKTDDESKLPKDVRGALTPELRSEWLFQADGLPVTLETLLQKHLGREFTPVPSSQAPSSVRVIEKSEARPGLAPDADFERTFRLSAGTVPLHWMQSPKCCRRVYLIASSELQAFSLADGQESRYQAVAPFTHVAETANGFVAANHATVALYGSSRAPLWVFQMPISDALPSRPGDYRLFSDDNSIQPELSDFRLCGMCLVARLGERHLIAFDLQNHRVSWVLGADGHSGYSPLSFPEAPRFGSELFMNSRFILVQTSNSQHWLIRSKTGEVRTLGNQTASVWRSSSSALLESAMIAAWPGPPAVRATVTLLSLFGLVQTNQQVVADAPALIRMISLTTGQVIWTCAEENRSSSLTGEPPQLRVWGKLLIVAVHRNHGVELNRLGIDNGKLLWEGGPAFLDTDRLKLGDADADDEHVYVPVGNSLAAIDLKNGKTAWEADLPELRGVPGWIVLAGQKCIIAYPRAAIPREPLSGIACRMLRSVQREPGLWRLPTLALGLYDAWVARSFPVLMFDLETGRLLGKIEVPAAGPTVAICFDRDRAVVATGDRVCWLK